MSEIKTKKKNEYTEEDCDVYSDNENEHSYFDSKYEEDQENAYYEETVRILKKELLSYIEDKSLTIGEYMSTQAIEKYLNYRFSK